MSFINIKYFGTYINKDLVRKYQIEQISEHENIIHITYNNGDQESIKGNWEYEENRDYSIIPVSPGWVAWEGYEDDDKGIGFRNYEIVGFRIDKLALDQDLEPVYPGRWSTKYWYTSPEGRGFTEGAEFDNVDDLKKDIVRSFKKK